MTPESGKWYLLKHVQETPDANKINHEIARMVNKQLDKLVRDISGMSMPATPRKSRQIGNRSRSENR